MLPKKAKIDQQQNNIIHQFYINVMHRNVCLWNLSMSVVLIQATHSTTNDIEPQCDPFLPGLGLYSDHRGTNRGRQVVHLIQTVTSISLEHLELWNTAKVVHWKHIWHSLR